MEQFFEKIKKLSAVVKGASEMKFFIVNESVCVRLMLHGEEIRKLFLLNGWEEVREAADANVIFINTCSFVKSAEDKAVSRVEDIIARSTEDQEIAVFGCLPAINPERLRAVHRGRIFPSRNIEDVARSFGLECKEIPAGHVVSREGPLSHRFVRYANRWFLKDDYLAYLYDKEKVFHLKIAEGCLGKCTYCAERLARGKLRSKRISKVLEEFRFGLDKGFRIFSLNADDVGMFGVDNGENTAELIEKMLGEKRDFRLVLTEFNPFALIKHEIKMLELLRSPKIIFITVPIESGSQKIVDLMKRPYDVADVISLLKKIRSANPDLKINTHIITGFPGETEEDFSLTARMLDDFYFNKVKIFKYSERAGTEAALFDGKIDEEEKERRRAKLERLVLFRNIARLDVRAFLLNTVTF